MTTFALVSGVLFRAPEQKTSKAGKPYVIATIKSRADDNRSEFWRLTAFSETAQAELLRLTEGDTVSAQGPLKAELWTPEGKEPRINLSIIADSVQPLRAAKKEREVKDASNVKPFRRSPEAQAANGPNSDFRMRHHGGSGFDDDLNDELTF